ncbi:DNA primase [Geosporobacter ferrireducens]|uniref:DNA primase n=1 Tax=Geosporobacter ferrireducens TaxID=1424294 RepID=A0A1D8GC48_9FIRM|nr:DNA primase [Geosporobacter ferrireducens]AOT68505.1 DNA primase [Geosporobacter ferrireducens]MTI53966.1 DNA primase [Geosporobacter ferrireducens]
MGINLHEGLIEEIRNRSDIVEAVSKYVNLKKAGSNYKGLCPFHHEKTPSFIVSEEKQLYHCFGCGEGGDIINFIMKMENLDFIDAVTTLGEKAGIRIEEASSKEEKKEFENRNRIYEMNREAALFFYSNLIKKENKGLEYLKERKVDLSTIKKFGLGYAENQWEALNNYLLKKGYTQEMILSAGLVLKRNQKDGCYDRFRNRIIFPIINTTGKVIGFGGRALGDEQPKYLNSPETSVFNKGRNLYGLNTAKKVLGKEKRMIVVEGYMDVISLSQRGISNVVASLGTALTKEQAALLKRYTDEVYIAYDGDSAGQAAALRGLEVLGEAGCDVKVVIFTQGKDPDEIITKKGKKVFLDELEGALSLIDYKITLVKKENDLTTIEGRIKFVKAIAEIIKQLKSPVEVDAYIKKISIEAQISEDAIKTEIYGNNRYNQPVKMHKPIVSGEKHRSKFERHTNKYNIESIQPTEKLGYLEAERGILKLMLMNKQYFNNVVSTFPELNFTDPVHKKIAKLVARAYEDMDVIDMDSLMNQLDINEITILHNIKKVIIPEDNTQKALIDFMNQIQKFDLMKRKKDIETELKEMEKKENKSQMEIARIRELCIQLEKILKELKHL